MNITDNHSKDVLDLDRNLCVIERSFSELELYVSGINSSEACNNEGCYDYIPYPPREFIKLLKIAISKFDEINPKFSKYGRISFLDVGCGIGSKLSIARGVDSRILSSGIEINPKYAKIAKKITGQYIFECNALSYTDYPLYDIVYFFCPFRDGNKQKELERIIVEKTKQNVIIIGLGGLHNFKELKQIDKESYVFIKK